MSYKKTRSCISLDSLPVGFHSFARFGRHEGRSIIKTATNKSFILGTVLDHVSKERGGRSSKAPTHEGRAKVHTSFFDALKAVALALAIAGSMSGQAVAKGAGKEAAEKSPGDKPVFVRVIVEVVKVAAGVGGAVGAGAGVSFTPSKIRCGKGESCR